MFYLIYLCFLFISNIIAQFFLNKYITKDRDIKNQHCLIFKTQLHVKHLLSNGCHIYIYTLHSINK